MKKLVLLALALFCMLSLQAQNKLFNVDYYGHLYFVSSVNGQPAHLLFDTGSPYVCLDSIFFENSTYKYKSLGNATMGGSGNNKVTVKIIMGELTFTIGDEQFRSTISPIVPLKPIVGDYVDGILGISEIKHKAMVIDYKNKKMGFYDKLEESDIKGYTALPLRFENNRFYVTLTVAVNNEIEIKGEYLVDIGNAGSINLTSAVAKKYSLENLSPLMYCKMDNGGIGGESTDATFRGESIKIGPFELKKPVMEFSFNTGGALADKEYAGLIGNEVLERFDVIIDPVGKKLYLKPNADFSKPFNPPTRGFVYTDRSKTLGYWVVNGVYKDSNADKAGLKNGDRITAINGRSVKEISFQEQRTTLFKDLNGVALDVERGNQQLHLSFDFDQPKI